MANGFGQRIAGLLGNPTFNLGVGLLAAGGPSAAPHSFGQDLAGAVQFASERQRQQMENQVARERLLALQRQRQAGSAVQELLTSLGVPGDAPSPGQISPLHQRILQTMAQTNPQGAMQGLLGLLTEAEPTGLKAKLATVEQQLGRKLTEKEVLGLAGGGTTINIGDNKANEPIPVTQLPNVRMPDGSSPPLGTTFAQAQAAGARVFSASEIQARQQIEAGLGVLTDLRELAIGDDGVFQGVPSNLIGRFAVGLGNSIGALVGTEGSEARSVYADLSRGTIAPLIRSLGESGSLSDGDVSRALGLLPETGALPTSGREAEQKLRQLEQIFRRAGENLGTTEASGAGEIDLGGGWSIREVR